MSDMNDNKTMFETLTSFPVDNTATIGLRITSIEYRPTLASNPISDEDIIDPLLRISSPIDISLPIGLPIA